MSGRKQRKDHPPFAISFAKYPIAVARKHLADEQNRQPGQRAFFSTIFEKRDFQIRAVENFRGRPSSVYPRSPSSCRTEDDVIDRNDAFDMLRAIYLPGWQGRLMLSK